MSHMTICLLVFLFMIVMFFLNKTLMWVTSMACVVLLVLTGCLDAKSALNNFGSTTVITIASMFIVAAGLSRTQMITHLTRLLYKVTKGSYTKALASYVLLTCVLGQFIPSYVALFALVCPLAQSMCDEMGISPSKMMFPIAIAAESTSFIIEPIGPYAAWYVTDNGYMQSFGWTATKFTLWTETAVLLPVGLITILICVFAVPRLLPAKPEYPTSMIRGHQLKKQEPLGPVREFLGYAIFAAVILGMMAGFPAWEASMAGAVLVVASGVLTSREAIERMNMETILLYVGVVIMGLALGKSGAAEALGKSISGLLGNTRNGYAIGGAFFLIGFIMTSILYDRAVTTVLIPLTVMTCASLGCDPRGPIILVSLASMSSLITPMASAVVPMAMSAGGYSQKTILKAGLLPALLRGLVGVPIAMTLYPAFGA